MYNMGFGPNMCRLIFLLGQNLTSCVMLNGGVTLKVFLTRSVRQECQLSPLLFAIVTHPLGYLLGVDVANVQLIDWISIKLTCKFMYWKSPLWPFHVRLKVVQRILIPMLLYFLPLLP